jgi:hypothetical protein
MRGGVSLMGLCRVVAPTIALLIVGSAAVSPAGEMASRRGRSFGEPSGPMSTLSVTGGERRVDRSSVAGMAVFPWFPFGGTSVIPWDPDASMPSAVVPENAVETAEPVIASPPEPPVAPPKFVLPPTPGASPLTGAHTVIIQRGSNIEVQSLSSAR